MEYHIYTDGACSGNGYENAKGGWAYVHVKPELNQFIWRNSGYEENTTNQRMELMACVMACEELPKETLHNKITVFSDSAYLINCYSQKWYEKWESNGWINSKKEPVANKDLWERLLPYFKLSNFTFKKVKGHSSNEWNNLVDSLAVQARKRGDLNGTD